jgi:hypothetical protein
MGLKLATQAKRVKLSKASKDRVSDNGKKTKGGRSSVVAKYPSVSLYLNPVSIATMYSSSNRNDIKFYLDLVLC